jgi:hypothetical protein
MRSFDNGKIVRSTSFVLFYEIHYWLRTIKNDSFIKCRWMVMQGILILKPGDADFLHPKLFPLSQQPEQKRRELDTSSSN